MIILACILLIVLIAFLFVLKVEKILYKVLVRKQIKTHLNVRFLCGNKSAFSRLARDGLIRC